MNLDLSAAENDILPCKTLKDCKHTPMGLHEDLLWLSSNLIGPVNGGVSFVSQSRFVVFAEGKATTFLCLNRYTSY